VAMTAIPDSAIAGSLLSSPCFISDVFRFLARGARAYGAQFELRKARAMHRCADDKRPASRLTACPPQWAPRGAWPIVEQGSSPVRGTPIVHRLLFSMQQML
jgi:hypothetical protein